MCPVTERPPDLSAILDLELAVWEALRTGDADADRRLLSPDFVGLYPTGFATREDHAGELAKGPTVGEYSLHETRLLVVSERDVLLCYRADWCRVTGGTPVAPESMYISSLWSESDGQWLNMFSQDTPVEPA